jgi:hypothetical protein
MHAARFRRKVTVREGGDAMPHATVDGEAAEVLGRLLEVYGEPFGVTRRSSIAAVRRDNLRGALKREGVDVSPHAAGVLADGMAGGQLVITDGYLHLINNGDRGVKATCKCRSGKSGCTLSTTGGKSVLCYSSENSCKNCEFTLGLTVTSVNVAARTPAQSGAQFAGHLPGVFSEAITHLARLTYPVVDRLTMHEQAEGRLPASTRRLLSQLTFPMLTLPDALDRLLTTTGTAPSAPAVNLLRLAVGDYPDMITGKLATAVAVGTVAVDDDTRSVAVLPRTKPGGGVTVDVTCSCWSNTSRGCLLAYGKTILTCVPGVDGCTDCVIGIRIPDKLTVGTRWL